jgi:hypothetical protein
LIKSEKERTVLFSLILNPSTRTYFLDFRKKLFIKPEMLQLESCYVPQSAVVHFADGKSMRLSLFLTGAENSLGHGAIVCFSGCPYIALVFKSEFLL